MLTQSEKKTIEYYDQNAKKWSRKRSPMSNTFWEPYIDEFKKLLPQGKIIEIGSGSGREANKLIAQGYAYTGTDISKGLLEFAKKNNPKAKFLLKSVYDLGFPPNSFDGFWTSATLLHVPKSKIEKALESIRKTLKSGSIGFISLKESRSVLESEKEKTGRFFEYYKVGEFDRILEETGFEIIESSQATQTRKNGDIVYWLTFFVQKI